MDFKVFWRVAKRALDRCFWNGGARHMAVLQTDVGWSAVLVPVPPRGGQGACSNNGRTLGGNETDQRTPDQTNSFDGSSYPSSGTMWAVSDQGLGMKQKIGWIARMIPGLVNDIESMRKQMADKQQKLTDLIKQREKAEELLESLDNAVRIREDDWWMMGGEESAEKEQ